MKICIITSSFRRFEGDYAGQHVYAQACGLARKHDVYVIYPTDRDNPDKVKDPFHHLPFEYPFKTYPMAQVSGLDFLNVFRLFFRMRREILKAKRKYKIDLFYAFWAIPNAFICALVCGKTPYIVNVAGADDVVFGHGGIARPLVKYALVKAKKVISLSQDLKKDAICMGTKEKDIFVIPSGINIDYYKPRNRAEIRKELKLPDKFTIVYVGSLFKLKRIEWLIRISAELGKTHSFISLIIGDGPEKETLRRLAAQLKADNIRFIGHVAYNRVPLYISSSNVLVLFSETEGLPSVVQEALASGVPVVATAVGGITDIVRPGMTGFVVKNEIEARHCLAYLMESPLMVDHMGIIARTMAENHLSHEHVFKQVSAVCESIIDEKNSQKSQRKPIKQNTGGLKEKQNIGILSTFPSNYLSYLIEVQKPYARDIHVIAPEITRKDILFHPLEYDLQGNIIRQFLKQLKAQFHMARDIIKIGNKADFWIFVAGDVFLLPLLTAKILRKPVMLTLLGNLEFETRLKKNALNPLQLFLRRINCFLANRIIVYSQSLQDKWHLNRYNNKILIAQSQHIDLTRFTIKKPLLAREKLVGYVGRLSPEKGIWNLIKSMPLVFKHDPDIRLLVIGDGPLYENIKEFLEKDGLKEKIILTGKVPFERIPKYMNRLRLLVMPSLSEGLPATLLEAMACGTPVLATPAGAIVDVITNGKTGFLLQDNSCEAIARGILEAVNHPKNENIACAARKMIEKEFSLAAARRNYEKVLIEGNLLSKK